MALSANQVAVLVGAGVISGLFDALLLRGQPITLKSQNVTLKKGA